MPANVPIEIGQEYVPWAGLCSFPKHRIRVVDEWRPEGVRGAPRYVTYVSADETPLEDWMPGGWYLYAEDGKRRCNATEFRAGFRLPEPPSTAQADSSFPVGAEQGAPRLRPGEEP